MNITVHDTPHAPAETPTQKAIAATPDTKQVRDKRGRLLTLRRLDAFDMALIYKAIGAVHANTFPYVYMVTQVCAVTHIDGEKLSWPGTDNEIMARIKLIGTAGIDAVAASNILNSDAEPDPDTVKN